MAKDFLTSYMKQRAGLATNRQAELCYEAILEEIGIALASGEKVVLRPFGTFAVRKRAARIGRNPSTGAAVPIPPRTVAVFSPGEDLKRAAEAVGKGKASLWLESRDALRNAASQFEEVRASLAGKLKEPGALSRDAKAAFERNKKQLDELLEKARYRLDLLRRGSADAIGELAKGFEAAFGELKKAAGKAGKKL